MASHVLALAGSTFNLSFVLIVSIFLVAKTRKSCIVLLLVCGILKDKGLHYHSEVLKTIHLYRNATAELQPAYAPQKISPSLSFGPDTNQCWLCLCYQMQSDTIQLNSQG